jgi:hypothetical protein
MSSVGLPSHTGAGGDCVTRLQRPPERSDSRYYRCSDASRLASCSRADAANPRHALASISGGPFGAMRSQNDDAAGCGVSRMSQGIDSRT